MSLANGLYVQFGAGFCAPEGWVNFDASPTLRFERIPVFGKLVRKNAQQFPANVCFGDIVRGLPVAPGSCRGIYASHVLEHLALEDFRISLKHTYDLLEAGGLFRLVVPDLEKAIREYVSSNDAHAASAFMHSTSLGREKMPRGLLARMSATFGLSQHLWMWDYKGLKAELLSVGFANVRRCNFNDSSDRMFNRVEERSRFEGSLAMEAVKGGR